MFNKKAMIENRDKAIGKQYDKILILKSENKALVEENVAVHEENKDLRFEIEELSDTLKEVLKLAEGNAYNNEKIVLNKIKELAKTPIKN